MCYDWLLMDFNNKIVQYWTKDEVYLHFASYKDVPFRGIYLQTASTERCSWKGSQNRQKLEQKSLYLHYLNRSSTEGHAIITIHGVETISG